jgi:hypothetical protein
MSTSPTDRAPWAENRLGLDYRAEAARFAPPATEIIDVHTHVNGGKAAAVWREAAHLYGVTRTYTQTRWDQAHAVRETLGDTARFIAIPEYGSGDPGRALGEGMLEIMPRWAEEFGARMVKFWMAPRLREFLKGSGHEELAVLDSPIRRKQADLATELNMMLMAHIADPDTWFRGKYSDSAFFGSKKDQYSPLQAMLERYTQPWMIAHMGGWPEDLDFLDTLLDRYPHAHLDTSATKWMVRELSKHGSARVREFFERWRGRLFFGTDVVTSDDHLAPVDSGEITSKAQQANSPEQAFELYASRYWAMRTLLETDYDGPSPIADGDLAMLEPDKYDAMSAPRLRGHGLSGETLRALHCNAAAAVLDAWYDRHT